MKLIRVLIVDDDSGFRSTLRNLLAQRQEAVIVGEAADGEEALSLAESLHPDILVMDLAMPRMNGLEATRRLRTRGADPAVIILTVHDEEVYRRTAMAAGAAAYLEKKMVGLTLWPTVLRVAGGSQTGGSDAR
jgi:DNA-binding NarL/FixJ family response regulator